jgi:hypothetical protein
MTARLELREPEEKLQTDFADRKKQNKARSSPAHRHDGAPALGSARLELREL